MPDLDPDDLKALRAMTQARRLQRGLNFIGEAFEFKAAAVHIHHPGWTEEKVRTEVRRWVRDGMRPEVLYKV